MDSKQGLIITYSAYRRIRGLTIPCAKLEYPPDKMFSEPKTVWAVYINRLHHGTRHVVSLGVINSSVQFLTQRSRLEKELNIGPKPSTYFWMEFKLAEAGIQRKSVEDPLAYAKDQKAKGKSLRFVAKALRDADYKVVYIQRGNIDIGLEVSKEPLVDTFKSIHSATEKLISAQGGWDEWSLDLVLEYSSIMQKAFLESQGLLQRVRIIWAKL